MVAGFPTFITRIKAAQWILIGVGILACAVAFVIGVSDNPPGIICLYIGLTCLAGAWVWGWPSPKDFWILLIVSLIAFPVGAVLHNLFDALSSMVGESQILIAIMRFFDVLFFLVAVMAVGPTALVALVGGICTSWRGMDRLTLKNRSFRRFQEKHIITDKTLRKLVNLARQSASGANRQPLKFILSNIPVKNQMIFPALSWAAYLKDWEGPVEGERPSAYLILLGDKDLANSFQYDAGIASQSITLGAAELGLGACLIGSIKRDSLRRTLSIPERYEILLVIALGKPAERVVLDRIKSEDIKYWRDEKDIHHVPKRDLGDMIIDI